MAIAIDSGINKMARHDVLSYILPSLDLSKNLTAFSHPYLRGIETCYAIPRNILDALSDSGLALFTSEELKLEYNFEKLCSKVGMIGFGANGPLVFPILKLSSMSSVYYNPKAMPALINTERLGRSTVDQFKIQQLAYLGWLATNPIFLNEKSALLNYWISSDANPTYLKGPNHLKQFSKLPAQAQYSWLLQAERCNTFLHFYRRWDLDGLATWDLPMQVPANVGGCGHISELLGIDHNPAIHLPETLRLPTKLSPQSFLVQSPSEHLKEWRNILEKNQTKRRAEGFVIHFYQDIVLKGIFGADLHRCQSKLDQLLAQAFRISAPLESMKGMNVETIKKVRQKFQRRR